MNLAASSLTRPMAPRSFLIGKQAFPRTGTSSLYRQTPSQLGPLRRFHAGFHPPHGYGAYGPSLGNYGMGHASPRQMQATTILSVRRGEEVVVIGDGQVSAGSTIVKPNAKKLRILGDGKVIVGVAGATADALTLVARLEEFIGQYPDQLLRSCVELAKLWRTDRVARRLDAALLVSDRQITLEVNGNGDVIEPFDDVMGIGSGSLQAVCAARALMEFEHIPLEEIARKAMKIAADSCVYTNEHWTIEKLMPLTEEEKQKERELLLGRKERSSPAKAEPVEEEEDSESD